MYSSLDYIEIANLVACFTGLMLLAGGIVISFLTRFVQLRTIPRVMRMLLSSLPQTRKERADHYTVPAHQALFTAMSTTIGIASIVSPIFAIKMGGPGALIGFLLTALFGSASTFAEVTFALIYRKRRHDGSIAGGPMQYLADEFSKPLAHWYALSAFALLVAWTANQANTIADILLPYGVPVLISGVILALMVLATLFGGIQRVSRVAEKMVPFMFILFISACSWILWINAAQLPAIIAEILSQACSAKALSCGIAGGGLLCALRWGLLKGIHSTEAGVGTAAIPHSMAQTSTPANQGILAMVSVWSVCFISLLSGLVVLATQTWQDASLGMGINVIIKSFALHFPSIGPVILIASAFLFAFGTILGNSYNSSQCFLYLTNNHGIAWCYSIIGAAILAGTLIETAFAWTFVDFLIIPVAVPHISAIVILALRKRYLLDDTK